MNDKDLFFLDNTGSEDVSDDMFFIDTTGSGTEANDNKLKRHRDDASTTSTTTNTEEILYRTDQSLVLGEEVEEEVKPETNQGPKAKRIMFPRHVNKRYHEREAGASNFRPGQMSDKLREALGLRHNQLPYHIYRMRYLGYPPGWLRKAQIRHSGIAVFDDSDASSAHTEAQVEYDLDQLVAFPGFNVVPQNPRCADDWKNLGSMPMQEHHNLESFRSQLRASQTAQKGTGTGQVSRERPDNGVTIEEEVGTQPAASCLEEGNASLLDLEETRQRLLAELAEDGDEGGGTTATAPTEDVGQPQGDVDSSSPSGTQHNVSASGASPSSLDLTVTADDSEAFKVPQDQPPLKQSHSTPSTEQAPPSSPSLSFSVLSDLGSPVLHRQTSRVPSFEKFSEGISPHRPFENLPGAIGTFSRVNEVINRNQKVLRRSQSSAAKMESARNGDSFSGSKSK